MTDEVDEKDIPGFLRGIEASKLIAQDVYDDGYRDGWNEAIEAAAKRIEERGVEHMRVADTTTVLSEKLRHIACSKDTEWAAIAIRALTKEEP